MPDYKQTTINGTSWQRAWRVECENPLQGQRQITFHEETVANIGDSVMRTPAGSCSLPFDESNAGTEFDLLNPDTGGVIGTSTYAQAYVLLHSLYMHAAQLRDAAAVEPEIDSEDWPYPFGPQPDGDGSKDAGGVSHG